ncbi:MAG: hypothetical protein L6R38_003098 [Xanthoria sp. 2 TBL-2021]|nr:MAG: hypothetical protein L6R38_003098 [Xanthoria sp. 2 TBL-2021]
MDESRPATDLGGDIWHIINHLLLDKSPRSLWALRSTPRSIKVYVDPVVCHCLKISGKDEKFDSLDSNDDLSQHVRHLVVSNIRRAYTDFSKLQETSDKFCPGDLVALIEKLHGLRTFSFSMVNHIAMVTATLWEILLERPNLRKLDIKFGYNWLDHNVK